MDIPAEFFSPTELAALLGTPQKKQQRAILTKQGVPFVVSAAGLPRVYRDKLLPVTQITHNADFDYSAIHSARRKAAKAGQ